MVLKQFKNGYVLPFLSVGPGLDLETPSPSLLAAQLKRDLRDASRIDKCVVRLARHRRPRTGQVNYPIDDDQRDVDPLGPELARHSTPRGCAARPWPERTRRFGRRRDGMPSPR